VLFVGGSDEMFELFKVQVGVRAKSINLCYRIMVF